MNVATLIATDNEVILTLVVIFLEKKNDLWIVIEIETEFSNAIVLIDSEMDYCHAEMKYATDFGHYCCWMVLVE